MNAKQAKYPQLRFKGFTDPWEKRKLGEISKTTIGEFVIKNKQDSDAPYPVYNGGISYTGFYDEFNNEGDKIVISARGANAGFVNYIDGRFWAGNSCYSVDILDRKKFSVEFMYQFLKRNQHLFTDYQQAANIPSVSKKDVATFIVQFPTQNEQREIASFFKQLDNLITLHQRKLAKLKELKQGYLQKLFPQNGSKFPQLRFAGFADAWEQRKLTEIVNRVNKSSNSDVLPKVEFEDIVSGEGRLNKDISSKLDSRKGTLFESENILYGKLRPYLKNWLFPDFEGVALGDFWVFEATDVSVPSFDYYLIQSDDYQKVANDTSGTKMPRSDWKNVSSTDFAIPSKDEQKQIGTFFKQLDNTITLHQRKLEKLQELKKGYLQKMFC
ncbi:restriction endonuclease subunit S [Lacticaseibacillus paracasei]|uniref:Restriction endonuclease subunit S n=1 Tax=Lacticaseibacillus paracasei TaxID=1597 RepID=A0AAP4NCD8_LACPA|nr:restriction endonuclease subunit S [Lacticaseibacillus paracasei]MDE5158976.1 restriction endonuclease subunit S [Lacticaseibacillus paracasei]MDM7455607.1 restriction endonuclease subunit S [Lacticaseibacillus paracasei]MDM7472449.1 restriction endonuclease subunit S [Lacticaseibacillus paracasei]